MGTAVLQARLSSDHAGLAVRATACPLRWSAIALRRANGRTTMINVLTMKGLGAVAAVAALSGCAALNRTRPGDMTVPEHEHAAQVDLRKSENASKAAATGGRGEAFQRYSERRYRELAAAHAAAAAVRRKAVSETCAGADASSSLAAMKVAAVEPIRENEVPKRLRNPRGYYPERLRGARIALQLDERTAPLVAARAIECEAARAAAAVEPVDLESPLAVQTAKAAVRAEGGGVVVEVRGDGGDEAEEILRRATALAQATPQSAR
jgi:hypothetical protein